MKILITGFTGVQTNASAGQLRLISNINSIRMALEDLGHEVEWRPVTPGEDLGSYDRIVVSINGTGSWVSPFALGGLWCIGKRKDTIFTLDDWQAHKAFTGGVEKEQAVVWNPKLGRIGHDEAFNDPHIKGVIDEAVEELCYIHHRKELVPLLPNGDLEALKLGAPEAVAYDPSSYMFIYEYAPNVEKTRAWVCAGLSDKARWIGKQRIGWEIEYYGVRKLGQPRVPEAHLAGIYSERWGVLSPPHHHAGSGWFRVRFLMAAEAGSVLLCDMEEGKPLGPSYINSPAIVEQYSDAELKALAACQKEELYSGFWSKEKLQRFLADYMEV